MDSIADAIPETPDDSGDRAIHYTLEAIEGVEVGLGIIGAELGLFGLGIEIAGPIAGMAAVFVAIGGAHAEAINSIITDQIYSGFSHGVVLGADGRSVSYVKSHFVKWSPVSNAVYPEYGKKFQNAYNRALVAGYAQGKRLTKPQMGAFFADLFSRMSVDPSVTYGEDSKEWSERTWLDYYIECAAVFRSAHLAPAESPT
jgi:hypothetical protein